MAKEIILSKESSESEIKAYFNAVLRLSQSDNEFPINLDEVWPLVYSEKSKSVRALRDNFIENVDFITIAQNGEGGRFASTDYYLTLSCMEFFIARKVRPVFDVYRKVFHRTVQKTIEEKTNPKREPSLTTKVRVGLEWVKGVSEMLNLNDSSKLALLGKLAKPLHLPLPDYTPSHGILKSATELLKENGIQISAREFNTRMVEKGFLTIEKRKSKGGYKEFKHITKEGLKYGENQVNPHNPNSTQPSYYVHEFTNLLHILEVA